MTASKPHGAEITIEGLWYKRGLHGLIFRWGGDEWVKSGLEQKVFDRAASGMKRVRYRKT